MIFVFKITTSKCFALFELIFLLRLVSLASKSVYVTKFACANFALNFPVVNLFNSEVVMYSS